MASRQSGFVARLASFALVALVAGCATDMRRFPLREPMTRDPDLRSVTLPCVADPTPKDPHHVTCAPASQYASLLWDGGDNLLFRPLSESLGVPLGRESVDVNSFDEVPDSSWFTNRAGARPLSPEELRLGACKPSLILEPDGAADGTWVIDRGKSGGSTDGFRVNVPGKGKYFFKADDSALSEHSSAAQTIGATAFYAAGYYTTCEQVVYFRRSLLKLSPGLHEKHNFGHESDFGHKELDAVLAHCPRRGDLLRMQASAWLPGYPIGGFRYEGVRSDDPNDVVPHEDRRELRAMRLLAAWLDRFDTRTGNTLDTWMSDVPGKPEASPGHVIHNQMDTSECLGSTWDWDQVSRRLGFSYVLDWGDAAADFVTLGIPVRTWDTVELTPGRELFAYFNVRDFVPDEWKNEYPVASFSRMTERDGAWMARILARFTPAAIHAMAKRATFSDQGEEAFVESVLAGRLGKILERYLTRLSSIADVHLEGDGALCGVDLAELRELRGAAEFRYTARVVGGGWLDVERRPGAQVCAKLPRLAGDGGPRDDARERYVRVRIEDGVAAGPLVAHLYDLGAARGYRLVGLERPQR